MKRALLHQQALENLLGPYGLRLQLCAQGLPLPGSYWGDSEAGLVGDCLYFNAVTPLHSVLHEAAHFVCMDERRRAALDRDAGGDDLEESAVCYLQVLWADGLPGVGQDALMHDMDEWGYSFRLGSTARWFHEDASDARDWLHTHGILCSADGAGRDAVAASEVAADSEAAADRLTGRRRSDPSPSPVR